MKLSSILPVLTVLAAQVAQAQIDATTYDEMKYTAYLSSDAYVSDCANPEGTKLLQRWTTGAKGYLSVDAQRKWIVMVFRGTNDVEDYQTDLDNELVPYTVRGSEGCVACKVHNGMQKAWATNADSVITAIKSAQQKYPDYRVIVTGHSLGGAYTGFAGATISKELGPGNVTGYGFASPRFGNQAYAKYQESQFPGKTFYRVTSKADGVPQDLKVAAGFYHGGNEYWIRVEPNPTAADIKVCNGSEDPDCNAKAACCVVEPLGINGDHLVYFKLIMTDPVCAADPAKQPAA